MIKRGWGVLGGARIAARSVVPAILSSSTSDVVAIASKTKTNLKKLSALAPNARTYTSYASLIEGSGAKFIYIPLPNTMHVEWILKALDQGKHVLCEKPLAMHESDFNRIEENARPAHCHISEALMCVYHPQWTRTQELLTAGILGKVQYVDSSFCFFTGDPLDIRNQSETGGGALRDLGVYPIALTRFVTGYEKPTDVSHIGAEWEFENGVDTLCAGRVKFLDFILTFEVSIRRRKEQRFFVVGDAGTLRLTQPFTVTPNHDCRIEIRLNSGEEWIERFPYVDQYSLMIEGFMEEAEGKRKAMLPLDFSRTNQMVVDQLFLSMSSKH